ncbi:hypothetical protein B0H13DRAFT_2488749 [Mycena leptocephala]|nr:hypothetical protein B0H13DRAFT_2488749 [Mycena leptocephala]
MLTVNTSDADWSSQAELAINAGIFVKLNHALLGVYAWEWLISLPFDWEVLTGRKPFRWPLAFYFPNRYLLLAAMTGITVALDSTKEMNCQAIYAFNQFAGDAAVGLASVNLSLRTLAIWSQNGWIKILLIVIILGHWSLILQGVLLKAHWDDQAATCVITSSNSTILAATFTYSMGFDLLVFLLNAYKLGIKRKSKSKLSKMIFKDGLIFFFIAFLANLVATIFMFLNLNSIMTIIFNVPAAMASTIVATRAVRRLTSFTHKRTVGFEHGQLPESQWKPQAGDDYARRRPGCTRTCAMETVVREDGPVSPAVEYEVNELELTGQAYDVEAKATAL